jgi:hypothetical protein
MSELIGIMRKKYFKEDERDFVYVLTDDLYTHVLHTS